MEQYPGTKNHPQSLGGKEGQYNINLKAIQNDLRQVLELAQQRHALKKNQESADFEDHSMLDRETKSNKRKLVELLKNIKENLYLAILQIDPSYPINKEQYNVRSLLKIFGRLVAENNGAVPLDQVGKEYLSHIFPGLATDSTFGNESVTPSQEYPLTYTNTETDSVFNTNPDRISGAGKESGEIVDRFIEVLDRKFQELRGNSTPKGDDAYVTAFKNLAKEHIASLSSDDKKSIWPALRERISTLFEKYDLNNDSTEGSFRMTLTEKESGNPERTRILNMTAYGEGDNEAELNGSDFAVGYTSHRDLGTRKQRSKDRQYNLYTPNEAEDVEGESKNIKLRRRGYNPYAKQGITPPPGGYVPIYKNSLGQQVSRFNKKIRQTTVNPPVAGYNAQLVWVQDAYGRFHQVPAGQLGGQGQLLQQVVQLPGGVQQVQPLAVKVDEKGQIVPLTVQPSFIPPHTIQPQKPAEKPKSGPGKAIIMQNIRPPPPPAAVPAGFTGVTVPTAVAPGTGGPPLWPTGLGAAGPAFAPFIGQQQPVQPLQAVPPGPVVQPFQTGPPGPVVQPFQAVQQPQSQPIVWPGSVHPPFVGGIGLQPPPAAGPLPAGPFAPPPFPATSGFGVAPFADPISRTAFFATPQPFAPFYKESPVAGELLKQGEAAAQQLKAITNQMTKFVGQGIPTEQSKPVATSNYVPLYSVKKVDVGQDRIKDIIADRNKVIVQNFRVLVEMYCNLMYLFLNNYAIKEVQKHTYNREQQDSRNLDKLFFSYTYLLKYILALRLNIGSQKNETDKMDIILNTTTSGLFNMDASQIVDMSIKADAKSLTDPTMTFHPVAGASYETVKEAIIKNLAYVKKLCETSRPITLDEAIEFCSTDFLNFRDKACDDSNLKELKAFDLQEYLGKCDKELEKVRAELITKLRILQPNKFFGKDEKKIKFNLSKLKNGKKK
jgi:hypothetical protein